MGPQFGKNVYISEDNGARNVKSDAQVAMNKNSDPVQMVLGGNKEPQSAYQCTYIFCEVNFKFKCLQLNYVNLSVIHIMPNGTGNSSVDIYG